jgi:hypothetical protein
MALESVHGRSICKVPPHQVWRRLPPFLGKEERINLHPSQDNRVTLRNGVLRKRYDFVDANGDKEPCGFAIVRYSADSGFCIHISGGADIWRKATGTALHWFKKDVQKEAQKDAAIADFVRKNPEISTWS